MLAMVLRSEMIAAVVEPVGSTKENWSENDGIFLFLYFTAGPD